MGKFFRQCRGRRLDVETWRQHGEIYVNDLTARMPPWCGEIKERRCDSSGRWVTGGDHPRRPPAAWTTGVSQKRAAARTLHSYRFGDIAAYCSNFRHFAFLSHPLGLRDNVRCSSWAHWKVRSGLPISDNWTFFARWYGWGATSDYWFKIGDFAPRGGRLTQEISGRRPPTNHSFSQRTRIWSFKWCKNLHRFFFRFVTMHAFDRQTDRILIVRPRLDSMQRSKN